MNRFKIIVKSIFKPLAVVVAAGALSLPAMAQRAVDAYAATRTIVLAAPQNLTVNGGVNLVTNGPVDVRMFDGIASLDFFAYTNTGTTGGTLTATVYGSPDETNLTALSSYSLASNTTITSTNFYFGGTNLTASETYLLPGSWIYPTANTAGWATPTFYEAPFTNSAAITLTKTYAKIGVSIGDAPRYLYVVWTTGGSITNFTVGATLSGFVHSFQLY